MPISSFSTFPGARASEANRGIDSGAWIGEINFLDEDKKAKGACVYVYVCVCVLCVYMGVCGCVYVYVRV